MECGAPAPLSRSLVSRPTRKLASRHRKPNTVSHLRTRRVRKPNRICRFHTLQNHASVTIPKSITSTLFVKQRGVWGQKSNKKRNQPQLAGLGARLPWTVQPGASTTANQPSGDRQHLQQGPRERTTKNRSQYGNRRVTPVRPALTRHWQSRMRQPRSEVPRGVDRVSCRPPER
jgi:hypothetical protein